MWDKIQEELDRQHMTVSQLAKLIEIHPSRLYDIKSGKSLHPSFELFKLFNAPLIHKGTYIL